MDFNDLVAQMYRAVDHQEAFVEIAEALGSAAGIAKGVIAVRNSSTLEMVESHQWGIDEKGYAEYENYYYERDVFTQGLLRSPQGKFHANHQFITDKEFLNSEVYDGFGRPNGIRHVASSLIPIHRTGNMGQFVCIREPGGGDFERETLDFLDRIVPHFQQFVFLRNMINTYEEKVKTLDGVLAGWSSSAFVCRANRKVVYKNFAAEEMANRSSVIRLTNDYLSLGRSTADKKLLELIHQTVGATDGMANFAGGAFRVNCENELLEVLVSPLRYSTNTAVAESGQPAALVLIKDMHQAHALPVKIIQELFDLTPSEAKIASLLAEGNKPSAIAILRNTSIETVRSQIRNIYLKTNCSDQLSFASLLAKSSANFLANR